MITKINLLALLLSFILFCSCKVNNSNSRGTELLTEQTPLDKIQVLNLGTFHMGYTNDASTTEFDEHNLENQKNIHEIAKKIAAFKPTVIIVERLPKYDESLQEVYNDYLENPSMFFKRPSEIELLAYELGRLSGTKRIFGIDHKMDYNYNIGNEIENSIDPFWYNKYKADPLSFFPEINIVDDSLDLLSKLKLKNHDKYLDFLISVNADKLTHTGSEDGFEGADEAAKFYQRNLRMYSNLNRIDLEKEDRVFILMGASHTAFFRDFMSRSHKYEMVNTFKYLN